MRKINWLNTLIAVALIGVGICMFFAFRHDPKPVVPTSKPSISKKVTTPKTGAAASTPSAVTMPKAATPNTTAATASNTSIGQAATQLANAGPGNIGLFALTVVLIATGCSYRFQYRRL